MPSLETLESLIAFLSKVVDKSGTGRADPVPENPENPLNAVKNKPRRLCAFLDALAFLMVSEPKHQVFAISLRVRTINGLSKVKQQHVVKDTWLWSKEGAFERHINNRDQEFIEVMIASNDAAVPLEKAKLLHRIWTSLKCLSDQLYPSRQRFKTMAVSPPPIRIEILNPNSKLHSDAHTLIRLLLENIWAQICKRIASKYDKFTAIQVDPEKIDSSHSWFLVDRYMRALYNRYIGQAGPAQVRKPQSAKDWDIFWTLLFQTMEVIDNFVNPRDGRASGFGSSLIYVTGLNWEYKKYLTKIASIPREILTLWDVINSPQCRPIFEKDFVIRPTRTFTTIEKTVLPNNPEGWLQVFRGALNYRNARRGANEELELVDGPVSEALNKVNGKFGPNTVSKVIHAEIKVATEIVLERNGGYNPGFTYIGVSKLCCRPCYEFVLAMREFGIHFVAHGEHGKCYYPWTIPKELVKEALAEHLVTTVRGNLATKFCDLCHTDFFRVKTQSLRADDTDRTMSTEKKVGPSRDDPRFSNVLEEVEAEIVVFGKK